MPRHTRGLLIALPAALALGACSDGTDERHGLPPVASVTIVSTDSVLSPMESSQFQADIQDSAGSLIQRVITWSVSNTQLATISSLGLLSAVSVGSTYVVAEVDGIRDSLPLRITRSFIAVSAGGLGACAIGTDSTAYCWGNPQGTATPLPNGLPSPVDSGFKWTAINSGYSGACGIVVTGNGYCWGLDHSHSLGVADGTGFNSPSLVLGGYSWREINLGLEHGCGVTLTDEGICWGKNAHGEVGDSSHVSRLATLVHGGLTWTTLKADGYTSCGLVTGGQAYCWGINAEGYLGIDSTFPFDVTTPLPVQNSGVYVDLAIMELFQCGLTAAGEAWCWGYNTGGMLGIGVVDSLVYKTPQLVAGGHHFSAISGQVGACGLEADSTAWCWGDPGSPQPVQVPGGHKFVAISVGYSLGRSCGLTQGGALWCWGRDPLGDGVAHGVPVTTPVRVRDP